ncbi:MAG TPA: YkgJ family cysteine cluster protein [Flavipsychrobacter sp.]|nr:YkgJ family cysteine cluster protein [Flavipsychrobacter sp.]
MIPNWQQQAKEKQKAYKRLLEKGNKNKMLKALPDLHEEAFSKIDCLACANCCKNYSPRFKTPDIKRIARSLGMKEGDFVEQYLRLDEDNDYVVKQSPCPFLAEDNRCKIYEDRPSDCRRYPYTDEDVLLKRVSLTLKNTTVCPATFAVLERLMEMEGK